MSRSAIDYSELVPASPPPPLSLGYRPQLIGFVAQADSILREHGAVSDGKLWPQRHLARWRAQRLMRLLEQLGHRQRWEIRERTWLDEGGYRWSVQHVGAEDDRARSTDR